MKVTRAVQCRIVQTQVTSANRSDSIKRLRQIEDAERESPSTGRVKASAPRTAGSTSSQRIGRNGSLRRTPEKSRSSGGSPIARNVINEEREMYEEEEREARRRGEDVDRLRRARNDWRENYDELNAGWTDEEHIEEEHEISRKEADKVTIRNRPKIHELEFWKSQVSSNIVAASGDFDHAAWIAWIAPAFKVFPDINGVLPSSGDSRFTSINVKLASALIAMMQNGGDQAREVMNEARLKMAKGCRGSTPTIMKGRQLLAMIIDSFRSASNTDLD